MFPSPGAAESCPAIALLDVDIGTSIYQCSDNIHMTFLSSEVQRCCAVVFLQINIRTTPQQEVDNILAPKR